MENSMEFWMVLNKSQSMEAKKVEMMKCTTGWIRREQMKMKTGLEWE
jgi:hypothetical protein